MKKAIVFSLILIFMISFTFLVSGPIFAEENSTSTSTSTLKIKRATTTVQLNNDTKSREVINGFEKILSPDQIKYFEKIVRQGNSLYGIRISSSTATSTGNVIKNKARSFEKIAAPQFIHLYEQIKKVGTSLWGLPKDRSVKTEEVNFIKPEVRACVISAIESKDDSLKAANTYQIAQINDAISARTTCQKTAINTTANATSTESIYLQKQALNNCLKTFEKSLEEIKEASKKSHNTTWETYKVSLRACQPATSSQQLIVEDGGRNIFENLK